MSIQHAYSQTIADGTATSVVRPSDWNSAHNLAFNLSGNTLGSSQVSGQDVVFVGGNNITLSADTAASKLVFSGPNTVAQTAFVFSNSNGVSFGTNGSTITATVATNYAASNITTNNIATANSSLFQHTSATSAITSNAFPSANTTKFAGTGFTTTTAVGAVIAATNDSNGLKLGVPAFLTTAQSPGAYLTTAQPPGAYLTTGRASNDAIGLNTALTANGVSVTANSSGLSLNFPAFLTTAQAPGAYLTTARASNDAIGLNSALTANGVSVTANSSGLSLNFPAFLTTAAQVSHSHNFATTTTGGSQVVVGTANSAGATIGVPAFLTTYVAQTNQTVASGNIAGVGTTFAGANLSASMTMNSNGLNLSMSAAAPGGGGAINVSAGTTSGNLQTIQFDNGNGVSFGLNGSTVTASVAVGGGGGVALSAGSASLFTNGTVSFGNANNFTFHTSNGSVIGSFNPINIGVTNSSANGTTGVIDGAGAQYLFFGGNNITVSQSINGSSASLSIIAAAGGAAAPVSTYIPYYPASTGASTMGATGTSTASAHFWPVSIVNPVAFNELRLLQTVSYISSSVAGSQSISSNYGIYSNNAGTLSQISSGSYSMALSNSSVSATLSFPTGTGTAGYTYGTVTATATAAAQSLFGTAGNRIIGLHFGNSMSLSEGLYWIGVHQRMSSSSANVGLVPALAGNVMVAAQNAGPMGSSTAAMTGGANALKYKFGWGPYTSTGSAGYSGTNLPQSAFMSGIANTVTQMPMCTFISTV